MATKPVLKVVCLLLSFPLVVLSRIAEFLDLWNLKCDLSKCLQKIDDTADESIPGTFVHALVAAEDRRNPFHPGVDPIGIARAICARLTEGKLQGASTIEQQFVRVVSHRYEITFPRKVREQILAIAVSRQRRKDQIASAYLAIAHYGFRLTGKAGLRTLCGSELELCSSRKICEAIARLKYPEPKQHTYHWREKIFHRVEYVICRLRINTCEATLRSDPQCIAHPSTRGLPSGVTASEFAKGTLAMGRQGTTCTGMIAMSVRGVIVRFHVPARQLPTG